MFLLGMQNVFNYNANNKNKYKTVDAGIKDTAYKKAKVFNAI